MCTSSPICLEETGPAIRDNDGYVEASMEGQEVHYNLVFDLVKSKPCPYWPPQADDFARRRRRHGWPSKSTIDQIVCQGCDVVHVSHAYRRNTSDRTQWRLSFSRAETILIHSWTPVQKIIYHMLRYFCRKQFSKDAAISSYHLKTLLLWNCEERPADYWKSSCLVRITSDLLSQLVQNIRERRLFNYFITDCNLMVSKFDLHDSNGQRYDSLITKLFSYTRMETLAQWFFENYIVLAANKYYDRQLNQFVGKLVSRKLTESVNDSTLQQEFIRRFLSEYEKGKAAKTCVEMDHCITNIFSISSNSGMSLDLCRLILDRLPRIDYRFLEFFRSFICMKAAYRIDETGCLPDHETISLVIEVLPVPEKVYFSSLDQCHSESAGSYFSQALTLLLIARQTQTEKQLLLELGKAFLFKSLECENASSFFCATSAYLAAIFYQMEDYDRTLDFIKLVLTKVDHSACEYCTMQPFLPIIDLVLGSFVSISPFENAGLAQCSVRNSADRSSQNDVTPEMFADLLLAYIPSNWDQFEELCCDDVCKKKIHSHKHFRSPDSESRNSNCSATKLRIYLRANSATQIVAQKSVNETFSEDSIKSLVYSRTGRIYNRIKSNACGEFTKAGAPATRQFEMCYSRTEHEEILKPTKKLKSPQNKSKHSKADVSTQPTRNPCWKFARQHHTLISEVAAVIRRDLMNALMKVSVIHINTFNFAIENDADISTTEFFPHHYMALYHFKCGLFREALDIFSGVLSLGLQGMLSVRSSYTDIICSPPYWLLLPDDLKAILEEYRSTDECLTIDGRVMALYMKTQCLVNLDQPAIEVASTLLLLRGYAIRHEDVRTEAHVKMFSYLYTEVFRSYRGIITENESNGLSVIENGRTIVIWVSVLNIPGIIKYYIKNI